jgi:hypothetical protein
VTSNPTRLTRPSCARRFDRARAASCASPARQAACSPAANDITANLPPTALVNALVVDRLRPLALVVATTQGVFQGRSADQGRTWTWSAYNNGLHPAMDVHDLEVHPTTGLLRAGTFGRGAYEVFTSDPIGSVVNTTGRVTLLRAHDVGTGFGPPGDQLDAEAIVQLDGAPGMSFGFTLRTGADASTHAGMFDTLRDAVRRNRPSCSTTCARASDRPCHPRDALGPVTPIKETAMTRVLAPVLVACCLAAGPASPTPIC